MDFEKYEIDTANDLLRYFQQNMGYGFVADGKVYTENLPSFQSDMDKYYRIRLGEDLIKNKYGVCWDFCELEREFFESKKIQHECYFVEAYENRQEGGPTHTFALFKDSDAWCWFEYTWGQYAGIWKYPSKEDALNDVVEKFERCYNNKNVRIYKTEKVTNNLDTFEFVEHCLKGQKIEKKDLACEKLNRC